MKSVVQLALISSVFISGCSCAKNKTVDVPISYSQPEQEEYERSVPANPYDDGSGHSAGYEWAEENEVVDCGGNSESFIEGCEEYVRQRDEAVVDEDSDGEN